MIIDITLIFPKMRFINLYLDFIYRLEFHIRKSIFIIEKQFFFPYVLMTHHVAVNSAENAKILPIYE